MKLLKTALLSTVLMTGATFGADDLQTGEPELSAADASCVKLAKEFESFKSTTSAALITFITRDVMKNQSEEIVLADGAEKLTKESGIVNVLKYVRETFKKLVAEQAELNSKLATAAEAHTLLAAEKKAVEDQLARLREQLAQNAQSLEAKTTEAEAASSRVAEISVELEELQGLKEQGDLDATKSIERLEEALEAATESAAALKTEVERLKAENSALVQKVKQAEAEKTRIIVQITAKMQREREEIDAL